MEDPISIKDILARLNGEFPTDEAVIEVLPQGSKFLSVEHFGTSAWTITGKVIAKSASGIESAYFLKVAYGEHGAIMLKGEIESSILIHNLTPHFIPQPIGFGKYKMQSPTNIPSYFYLSTFVDMDLNSAPDSTDFTRKLADLRERCESPTGKFSFHVPTCEGRMQHTVDWEDSWAVFFQKLLLGVCKLDRESNGLWPELDLAIQQVVTKVIPRLLGALQAGGHFLKPCFIHGDLWEANVGISLDTGKTLLFDAGSYYAHNEMELGHWRSEFNPVFRDKVYTREYLRNYPAAEAIEEFDDRNRLYSIKVAMNYSAGHPGSVLRKTAYNNMCFLCEQYAPLSGLDKYDPSLDPSITGASIILRQLEEPT